MVSNKQLFRSLASGVLLLSNVLLFGQSPSSFPQDPVSDSRHTVFALTGATIVTKPGVELTNATLLIQDERILAVGKSVSIPDEAVRIDVEGKYIYPAFIEVDGSYGLPKVAKNKPNPKVIEKPQYKNKRAGVVGWNEAFHPEVSALELFKPNPAQRQALHRNGFATVLSHHHDGIARGSGVLIHASNAPANEQILLPYASAHYSFRRGSSKQQYPRSLMGAIALIRQSWYDARWYAQSEEVEEVNRSLQALVDQQALPTFFEVRDQLTALRADRIGDEFSRQIVIRGGGDDYQDVQAMRATGATLILPLSFPKVPDVSDPYDALYAYLETLKHWELAPHNPRLIYEAGIPFCLTSVSSDSTMKFWKQLQLVVRNGLPAQEALRSLTQTPARVLGVEKDLGSLEPGKYASFFVASADVFSAPATLHEVWSAGDRFQYKPIDEINIAGTYNINLAGETFTLTFTKKQKGWKGELSRTGESGKTPVAVQLDRQLLTLHFERDKEPLPGLTRLSGKVNFKGGILDGRAQLENGEWIVWSAIRQEKGADPTADQAGKTTQDVGSIWLPNQPYGWDTLPVEQTYFIEGATIWTCDSVGKLKGDVIVRNGKIEEVGKFLTYKPDMVLVNGQGKHITPGIVDEHSHIAISRGVNEGTQASSAEVRIGDVVNPNDINIYRQLAGGVTTAQLLHGSANPIGGQSALIKLKWGRSAEEMKIDDAPGFIKFALGENVKQSNWGDAYRVRFPQTRMGVEQVYYDYFYRAREYNNAWQMRRDEEGKFVQKIPVVKSLFPVKAPEPRRDLELEALAEILDSTRFITCHSYVQSEINMLMHVGDSMGFRVNTFTHVLEGYKLADKLREHGAGASTFADWWAYKFEVNDAIPYNAALLNEQGVLTGINSDDAEMGRRLNQEAAKAIKYGGVLPEEALKMVTINPATMLHLDHRIGTVTPGKDADLVLWDGPPLSVYSKPVFTMIEGTIYYSLELDQQKRQAIQQERSRLVRAAIRAKEAGKPTEKVKPKHMHLYHCDSEEDELD